ncbi:MAG TPA: hypothetical protein VKU01_24005 [Bryobacteraceae bacterium]|nr:hypothetical protein [Bryobacteraceae bacterium]
MVPWEHGEAFFRRQFADELHEARPAAAEQPLALATKGVEMLSAWLRKIEPELYPATWDGKPAVEVQLTGLIGGVPVHAIADAITTDGIVHDFKTASKKSGSLNADHARN